MTVQQPHGNSASASTPPAAERDEAADRVALADQLPADALYAAEQDMWVRLQGDGTAVVGVTHWVAGHGQFMLFSPRPAGSEVAFDRSLGVMETAKTAVAVHAPLSGRIVAVNDAVVANVELAARDPYGAGWLLRLQPSAWEAERDKLMDAAAYAAWLAPRLAAKAAAARPLRDEYDDPPYVDPNQGF